MDGYSVGDGCGIRYVYNNADGVIDVHTLREEIAYSVFNPVTLPCLSYTVYTFNPFST